MWYGEEEMQNKTSVHEFSHWPAQGVHGLIKYECDLSYSHTTSVCARLNKKTWVIMFLRLFSTPLSTYIPINLKKILVNFYFYLCSEYIESKFSNFPNPSPRSLHIWSLKDKYKLEAKNLDHQPNVKTFEWTMGSYYLKPCFYENK